jgi:SAM-dependent methyltransferase
VSELREAWEENAAAWVEWARAPGHDSYWRFHRDLFLEVVPPPRGRTLDLGCGEGRLARDLAALGHDVVGIDVSPTMIAAAREAAPEMELHVADAAALPFEDGSFGLVLAFMSLQMPTICPARSARRHACSLPAGGSASPSCTPSTPRASSQRGSPTLPSSSRARTWTSPGRT